MEETAECETVSEHAHICGATRAQHEWESEMTHGALRAWRASEGASISVGVVFCVCVSCTWKEVRGESRDSLIGESQDSPNNTTHMHYHYRIF